MRRRGFATDPLPGTCSELYRHDTRPVTTPQSTATLRAGGAADREAPPGPVIEGKAAVASNRLVPGTAESHERLDALAASYAKR